VPTSNRQYRQDIQQITKIKIYEIINILRAFFAPPSDIGGNIIFLRVSFALRSGVFLTLPATTHRPCDCTSFTIQPLQGCACVCQGERCVWTSNGEALHRVHRWPQHADVGDLRRSASHWAAEAVDGPRRLVWPETDRWEYWRLLLFVWAFDIYYWPFIVVLIGNCSVFMPEIYTTVQKSLFFKEKHCFLSKKITFK